LSLAVMTMSSTVCKHVTDSVCSSVAGRHRASNAKSCPAAADPDNCLTAADFREEADNSEETDNSRPRSNLMKKLRSVYRSGIRTVECTGFAE